MADSTPDLSQIQTSQSSKEVTANRNLNAAITMYGIEKIVGAACYMIGGRWGGNDVTSAPLTLTLASDNYIVANLSTGAWSAATSTTNWNDDTTYGRVAKVVMGASTYTSYEDHRLGEGGIFQFGGGGGGGSSGIAINPQTGTSYTVQTSDSDKLITFSNAASIAVTLPQATSSFDAPFAFEAKNIGVGAVTITPTTSTINGAATLVLNTGQSVRVISDGTNYVTEFLPPGATTNTQTGTSYTYLAGDRGKHVTHSNSASIAGTLPQATGAFGAPWFVYVSNLGVGTLTITPTTSTIDGAATLRLVTGQSAWIVSDGTNYSTIRGLNGAAVGYLEIPQNSKSAAYTTIASDAGKHIFHPAADTTARTWTIDSNANVPYPVGTAITFINQNAGGVITIAITSDTMRLAGAGTTGNRTLAANGVATAIKVTSTEWIVSGTGLT